MESLKFKIKNRKSRSNHILYFFFFEHFDVLCTCTNTNKSLDFNLLLLYRTSNTFTFVIFHAKSIAWFPWNALLSNKTKIVRSVLEHKKCVKMWLRNETADVAVIYGWWANKCISITDRLFSIHSSISTAGYRIKRKKKLVASTILTLQHLWFVRIILLYHYGKYRRRICFSSSSQQFGMYFKVVNWL